ncbi:type III secretion protein [Proteus alimentorum]|uniref:Type III secretion protein n=1 Tax=Proteus alimentorum TaxID=1973495 RepID=A0ABS0IX74_9GAMM|nr:type III secretion protein [Proteus alimentorum]MBG2876161.1 type III secretion protein [Proteus alimentorum]MBG2880620.1 type III secretion protein [Proteus alimentorum]
MLRSLSKDLLTYTREGVLIRARYVRRLDNIYKAELAAKLATKKILRDFNDKLDAHNKEIANQAYGKGLQALLGDILKFSIQYQEQLVDYEFQQREQIIATIAQFFDSPEIQIELTHRLISAIPPEKKITLNVPTTLRPYLEKGLNNINIELISHNNKTIAIHVGDQVTFFDPALLLNDLKAQFHQPFSESYQATLTQEIKEALLKFINTFDISDDVHPQIETSSEGNNED